MEDEKAAYEKKFRESVVNYKREHPDETFVSIGKNLACIQLPWENGTGMQRHGERSRYTRQETMKATRPRRLPISRRS